MKRSYFSLFVCLLLTATACVQSNPNLNKEGEDILQSNEVYLDDVDFPFNDTVYVPIYSDIYSKTKDERFLLTATLSIRNTSLRDSLFIHDIGYYDTKGRRVRSYLDRTLLLGPMQSIEYVIEKEDKVGGAGANFLISWAAQSERLQPLFQGVMVSVNGQQGIAFTTEGVSIKKE